MNTCGQCTLQEHSAGATLCVRCGAQLGPAPPSSAEQQSGASSSNPELPPPYLPPSQARLRPGQYYSSTPGWDGIRPSLSQLARQRAGRQLFCPATGEPTARFFQLARAIFDTIDEAVAPCCTGVWESSKMRAYQETAGSGASVEYEEELQICYDMLKCPAELHPHVGGLLNIDAFTTFLEFEIKSDPHACFQTVLRVVAGWDIRNEGGLRRDDLPAEPDPHFQARALLLKEALKRKRRAKSAPSHKTRDRWLIGLLSWYHP